MASVGIFDINNNRFKERLDNQEPSIHQGKNDRVVYVTDSEILGFRSLTDTVLAKYLIQDSGVIREMTAQEKAVIDAEEAAALDSAIRTGAKNNLVGFNSVSLFERALADIIKDELNIVRQWTVDFKAAVAASTSLADLKSRVALLSTLDARTLTQLRTAIQSRIDDHSVDA